MKTLITLVLLTGLWLPGSSESGAAQTAPGSDPATRLLLQEITNRQPAPYGLPDNWTYNYGWAQYAMSLLAAERCGYLDRAETVARLEGMLKVIEGLERYHGFFYDSYDLQTGKPTSHNVYFQGWWLYALTVLRSSYPELAGRCEKLLGEVDYKNSGMFNPRTRQLAADVRVDQQKESYWIDLYGAPAGEMRTAFVMYTVLTGDWSPWAQPHTPRLVDLEGHSYLAIWHNFVFCSMLVHSMFPDVGYFDRSWGEMLAGLEIYRKKNGMTFFPTRAESLEAWQDVKSSDWPNTEHRIAKPWLAWFADSKSPVMAKAFTPGHGVSLYYDNMNFYWSYGSPLKPCPIEIGDIPSTGRRHTSYVFSFQTLPLPVRLKAAHPPRLTSIQFHVSRTSKEPASYTPLEIRLNDALLVSIPSSQIKTNPTLIRRRFPAALLAAGENHLKFSTPAQDSERAYRLYARPHKLWKAEVAYQAGEGEFILEADDSPDVEITVDGQHDGGETPFALLARCAAVHNYMVWHELLPDEQFWNRLVAWVGDYSRRVRLARVVHNISDQPVTVQYERPAGWKIVEQINVQDITAEPPTPAGITVSRKTVRWIAVPRHTYWVSYQPTEK